jgi:hypothetical protein
MHTPAKPPFLDVRASRQSVAVETESVRVQALLLESRKEFVEAAQCWQTFLEQHPAHAELLLRPHLHPHILVPGTRMKSAPKVRFYAGSRQRFSSRRAAVHISPMLVLHPGRAIPKADFKYQPGVVVADGDYVMVHGRYVGWGPKPMVGVDIFRVANGKIAEHWDVLQEEVPAAQSANGNSMFTGAQA